MINLIYRFFWSMAGSDASILQTCPSPEKLKHLGIGASIFITAILAVLSGTYAVKTLVDSPIMAIGVGIFWGFVIFTIDRLLVGSMRKTSNNNKMKEAVNAIPRLVLAVVIALVISKPVEVKILENQIEKQSAFDITKDQLRLSQATARGMGWDKSQQTLEKAKASIVQLNQETNQIKNEGPWVTFHNIFQECETKHKSIQANIDRLNQQISAAKKDQKNFTQIEILVTEDKSEYRPPYPPGLIGELRKISVLSDAGKYRIGQIRNNIGKFRKQLPDCSKAKKERDDYYSNRFAQLEDRIENETSIVNDATKESEEIKVKVDSIRPLSDIILTKASNDIFGQLMALQNAKYSQELSQDTTGFNLNSAGGTLAINKEEKNMIWYISWAIMAFFLIIEMVPIFVKIITDRGPYDDILQTQEYQIKQEQVLARAEVDNGVAMRIDLGREKNLHVREQELTSNQQLLEKLSGAQLTIAQHTIEKWQENQLNHLEEHPEEFINAST